MKRPITVKTAVVFRRVCELSLAHDGCDVLDCRECDAFIDLKLELKRDFGLAPWHSFACDVVGPPGRTPREARAFWRGALGEAVEDAHDDARQRGIPPI